jgi:2-amino-4-hydroxy-6-hydroxymethyldihydropteridine diphosphokinase
MLFGVGLGGNLPGTPNAFWRTLDALESDGRIRLTGVSGWFRTAPWDVASPPYWNMVAVGETVLSPDGLFGVLEELERVFPRPGKGRLWPRVLDVDLLFASPATSPVRKDLILPHPGLFRRPVQLAILAEALQKARVPPYDVLGSYPPGHPLGVSGPAGMSRSSPPPGRFRYAPKPGESP